MLSEFTILSESSILKESTILGRAAMLNEFAMLSELTTSRVSPCGVSHHLDQHVKWPNNSKNFKMATVSKWRLFSHSREAHVSYKPVVSRCLSVWISADTVKVDKQETHKLQFHNTCANSKDFNHVLHVDQQVKRSSNSKNRKRAKQSFTHYAQFYK